MIRVLGSHKYHVVCRCGSILEYNDEDIHNYKRDVRYVACPKCGTKVVHHDYYRVED